MERDREREKERKVEGSEGFDQRNIPRERLHALPEVKITPL